MYKLYGNGIDDDYPAIQEMLDSGMSEIALPAPEKCYMISKTLKIHSNQCLKLGRNTTVMLTNKANCAMIENADFHRYAENICIDGGIWDMNHNNQWPHPGAFPDENGLTLWDKIHENRWDLTSVRKRTTFVEGVYTGMCMRFCRIKRFILRNITVKNPVVYAVQMGYIEDFTVSDIFFDFTEGSPKKINMDGIHLEGDSRNGSILNIKGATHDDLVAITADDGLCGPIENILVDGIFACGSHSAVRVLSCCSTVKNITIRNVFGSYYVYCIGLTKFYGDEPGRGKLENIIIENVAVSACEGTEDVSGGKYPVLWVENNVDVECLKISDVYREERTYPTPLLRIDKLAKVNHLTLQNVYQKNCLDVPVGFIQIDGEVQNMIKNNVHEL